MAKIGIAAVWAFAGTPEDELESASLPFESRRETSIVPAPWSSASSASWDGTSLTSTSEPMLSAAAHLSGTGLSGSRAPMSGVTTTSGSDSAVWLESAAVVPAPSEVSWDTGVWARELEGEWIDWDDEPVTERRRPAPASGPSLLEALRRFAA